MPSKKKRKLEVEDGSPDIPVLRALREELSLPYLPELFYPNEGDDEDPMKGRETRESAKSSAPTRGQVSSFGKSTASRG